MILYAKITMSDWQRYPWNLILIKIVNDIIVFLTREVSVNFCKLVSPVLKNNNAQRNRKWKRNSLKKLKHWYLIHTWSDKVFKGTFVSLVLSSLYGGSLDITLIVALFVICYLCTLYNVHTHYIYFFFLLLNINIYIFKCLVLVLTLSTFCSKNCNISF